VSPKKGKVALWYKMFHGFYARILLSIKTSSRTSKRGSVWRRRKAVFMVSAAGYHRAWHNVICRAATFSANARACVFDVVSNRVCAVLPLFS
jgi:hypothetical protein